MSMHTGAVAYYDREIELKGDYRPKNIVRPEDVWAPIAGIRKTHLGNIKYVLYARRLVVNEKQRDVQRRF